MNTCPLCGKATGVTSMAHGAGVCVPALNREYQTTGTAAAVPPAPVDPRLVELREALQGTEWRLTSTWAFKRDGGILRGVIVEVRRDNRWRKVGLSLYGPDEGTYADTLETIVKVMRGDVTE